MPAEWTKLRTSPGTIWLLAAAVVLTVAVSTAATAATRCPAGAACPVDPAKLSLTWQRHLEQIGPMTAGRQIEATTGLRSLPISPWAGKEGWPW